MIRKLGLCVLVLPILVLAGCFQPAGEAYQAVNSTLAPNTDSQAQATPNAPDLTTLPVTETPAVAITILAPDGAGDETPVPSTGDNQPTPADAAAGDGNPITFTQVPGDGLVSPTESTEIRTPVSPLGPVTPDTPAPNATSLPGEEPTATPSGLITPTALGNINSAPGSCTYTVQPGDTLYRIALDKDTSVTALRRENPQISGDLLKPGQVLKLPNCAGGAVSQPANPTPAEVEPTVDVPPGGSTYVVKRGDTLFAIARRFRVTVQAIVDANKLANPNALKVGQELIIPAPSN
jgi:LysM repeat protein